ncbi:MAG: VWA domain-containing protein [Phormidium sp.]
MFSLDLVWNKPAKDYKFVTDHILRVRINPSSDQQFSLPLRMAIALDTSSSMKGEKLSAAKQACHSVVAQLRDQDRLELASFATEVKPLLQSLSGNLNARESANQAISKLEASGVTRMDMALDWIQNALPQESGVIRIAILVTDGHATTPEGSLLEDINPLLEQAEKLSNDGIYLYTVALGNADNFNTEFLQTLSNRGQGTFVYAPTTEQLEPLIKERLIASQAIAIDEAQIKLTTKLNSVKLKGFCRFQPDYLLLEEAASGCLNIGAIRTDTPTDLLIKVEVPGGTKNALGNQDVIEVELTANDLPNEVRATAPLLFTDSYSQAEQVNKSVEADRINWEIKILVNDLLHLSSEDKVSEDLLNTIRFNAEKIGWQEIATLMDKLQADLKETGQLNRTRVTTTLVTANQSLNPKT